jgi:hypothetical protein
VNGNGLRRVFDAALAPQAITSPQGIGLEPVRGRRTHDFRIGPGQHLINQAHCTLVRYVRLDPGAI